MKVNKFDVVELNNENKATILDIQDNGYLVKVVNSKGISLGNKIITKEEIIKVIYTKNKSYNKNSQLFVRNGKWLTIYFFKICPSYKTKE
jgi:hypothetical protein